MANHNKNIMVVTHQITQIFNYDIRRSGCAKFTLNSKFLVSQEKNKLTYFIYFNYGSDESEAFSQPNIMLRG